MNKKQALKSQEKIIAQQEAMIEALKDFNKRSSATVKGLYQCIDVLIQGGNICERCEDYEECQLKAKEEGKGCEDWSMKDIELTEEEYDSKGIDAASPTGRG
jgi:hypothetical protein